MKRRTSLIGVLSVFLLLVLLAGCTSLRAKNTPSYVSVCEYQIYSCKQLNREMEHIRSKILSITGSHKNTATRDAVAMGPGVFFWPVLYFLVTDEKKEELTMLKGEYEALERVMIAKECGADWNKIEVRKQQDPSGTDTQPLLLDW